jgi:hypothetical protein
VQIEEVVAALRQLGGQATINETRDRVTENRGGALPGYKTHYVWLNEIEAVIEKHSDGLVSPRFTKGPIFFKFVRYGTVEEGEGVLDGKTVIALCPSTQL